MIGAAVSAGMAFLRPFAPWLVAAAVGAAVWHLAPGVGPGARLARASDEIVRLKTERADWERAARGWKADFIAVETLRSQEAKRVQAAVAEEAGRCAARVADARQSARVIERIVTKEPTYDENRCPVRELVDPGQLRDALQPRR